MLPNLCYLEIMLYHITLLILAQRPRIITISLDLIDNAMYLAYFSIIVLNVFFLIAVSYIIRLDNFHNELQSVIFFFMVD